LAHGGINAWEGLQQRNYLGRKWTMALDAGYRLAPTAGSDYPYLTPRIGRERNYVQLREPFTATAFLNALLAGRTYVTMGPVLTEFSLGGKGLGEELVMEAPGPARLVANVQWFRPVTSLAVVYNNREVAKAGANATSTLRFAQDINIDRSGWLILRGSLGLTTAPIYVRVGNQSPVSARAVNQMIADVRAQIAFIRGNSTFDEAQQDDKRVYLKDQAQMDEVIQTFERAIPILEARLKDARE
jgi:hypothetical protein